MEPPRTGFRDFCIAVALTIALILALSFGGP